jgi:hypothetical protein
MGRAPASGIDSVRQGSSEAESGRGVCVRRACSWSFGILVVATKVESASHYVLLTMQKTSAIRMHGWCPAPRLLWAGEDPELAIAPELPTGPEERVMLPLAPQSLALQSGIVCMAVSICRSHLVSAACECGILQLRGGTVDRARVVTIQWILSETSDRCIV